MIPIIKNNNPRPTEDSLRSLLSMGMPEAVQQLLDIDPSLKFKIENGQLVDSVTGAELWLKRFITEDSKMIRMKQDAMKLAKIDDEVLITGETGTGKELIARAMAGDREGLFVRINCAAMPEALIESELFGSVKGSYTGSMENRKGMILSANGGVMFLDEVGDLPLSMQAKLLNVLQPVDGKRYVRPVGGTDEKEITCRFVCATHKNLREMIGKGLFRQDLYARISTFELHITPIRSRKSDIMPILRAIGRALNMQDKAEKFMQTYGEHILNEQIDLSLNVRSLEQLLKRFNVFGELQYNS